MASRRVVLVIDCSPGVFSGEGLIAEQPSTTASRKKADAHNRYPMQENLGLVAHQLWFH
jgi:hypothetical protein